jgi:hypothetical protein
VGLDVFTEEITKVIFMLKTSLTPSLVIEMPVPSQED